MSSRNNNAIRDSTSPGYGGHRIYANVAINGRAAGKWMVDTGADISIMNTATARSVALNTATAKDHITLTGVTGASQAPVVGLSMRIENQPAFFTGVAVAPSNFNLLAIRDVSRVFNVNITATGTTLVPKTARAAPAEMPATEELTAAPPPAPVAPTPTAMPQLPFDITPTQLFIGVMFVMVLSILN